MKHVIKKQVLDLQMGTKADPFAIQQEMSDRYYQDLIPVMERLFDLLSKEDLMIKLDKLEINLGNISFEKISNGGWVQIAEKLLEETLQKAIREAGQVKGSQVQPMYQTSFEQWYYFMEHGFLPWNAGKPGFAWHDQVLESLGRNYNSATMLRRLIIKNEQARKRIIQQHDAVFLSHLVELLTAKTQAALDAMIGELTILLSHGIKQKGKESLTNTTIRNNLWTAILQLAASLSREITTEQLIIELLNRHVQLTYTSLARLLKAWPKQETYHYLPAIFEILKKSEPASRKKENRNDLSEAEKALLSKTADEMQKEIGSSDNNETKKVKPASTKELFDRIRKEEKQTTTPPDADATPEEGIFISNAGVVLLHVFLNHCFQQCGWVKHGKFIDSNAQQKAIYLIHYLATGSAEAAEYDLVIPKLLCGWPLELPVDTGIIIGQDALEEAENLLQVAIRQWQTLKNTSPDGLRINFLQREGMLQMNDEKCYLQVASMSAIDMLLDTLPWTLSMVKLPWMKSLLRVDWR